MRIAMPRLPRCCRRNGGVILVIIAVFLLIQLTWTPQAHPGAPMPKSAVGRRGGGRGLYPPQVVSRHYKAYLKHGGRGHSARSQLPNCQEATHEYRGAVDILPKFSYNLTEVAKYNITNVEPGGSWRPANCTSYPDLAVIIPFRDKNGDRTQNLNILITQLHIILQRQLADYTIVVVSQNGTTGWFNKGMLMNLGFKFVTETWNYSCIVFNDVDLIPIDDRSLYQCDPSGNPKHLSAHVNGQIVDYQQATGGVLAVPRSTFRKLNGFSNRFWGWGNEDDDLYQRIVHGGFELKRSDPAEVRFIHRKHKRSYESTRYRPRRDDYKVSGLNHMEEVQHQLVRLRSRALFTSLNYAVLQPTN